MLLSVEDEEAVPAKEELKHRDLQDGEALRGEFEHFLNQLRPACDHYISHGDQSHHQGVAVFFLESLHARIRVQ